MSDHASRGDVPRQSSPFSLNLDQLRKRAKDLRDALRAADPAAIRRIRAHHPQAARAAVSTGLPSRLADAQLVIAREMGVPSWPQLKAHVARMDRARAEIAAGAAPDAGMTTLHIRCGSDIAGALVSAGFTGGFLEYSDPLCQGPVVAAPDWLARRADFLAESYGPAIGQTRAEIAGRLDRAEAGLRGAAERHDRIVLWFEHDSYDQLILARCLAALAQARPARLELISPGRYPGGARFIGLGQLPPEALRLLWQDREPVTQAQLDLGRRVWDALRAPDPRPLAALAAGTPELRQMGRALRRHCGEFPSLKTGLGLTQDLILGLLAEEAQTPAQVFARLMREREPLPWQTDLMIDGALRDMAAGREPLLRREAEAAEITPLGREVLAGTRDAMTLGLPERWLGGVRIGGDLPDWRWDGDGLRLRG